jgi:hypothetical protein
VLPLAGAALFAAILTKSVVDFTRPEANPIASGFRLGCWSAGGSVARA